MAIKKNLEKTNENIEPIDKIGFLTNYIFFQNIFLEKEEIKASTEKMRLKEKAKEIGIGSREFEEFYKKHLKRFNEESRTINSNKTKFPNQNIVLSCGEWIADCQGVRKLKISTEEIIVLQACPHPIMITEIYRNIQENTEKVKLCFYKDDTWKFIIVNKSTVFDKSKIVQLTDVGPDISTSTSQYLSQYLFELVSLNPSTIESKLSTSKLGWLDNDFIPYDKNVVFDGDLKYAELFNCIAEKGNYKEWLARTKQNRSFNKITRLIISTGFASVLLEPLGALPFIVHLWGGTGVGKTVVQMIASSIWGNPEIGMYMGSLNNTDFSFELTNNLLTNLPLICDELQLLKNNWKYKDGYDSLIMTLNSMAGKGRGNKEGGKQTVSKWRNCSILSGEDPILSENSGGGARNRVIEIQTIEKLIENGNAESNFYRSNYGFAGKIFINKVKTIPIEKLMNVYIEFKNEFEKNTEGKQALSMAAILLADYISAKYIFNDQPLKPSDVVEYLQTSNEINIYVRAYIWLLSFIEINKIRFNKDTDVNKGEIWGEYVEDKYCFINKRVLEAKMKDVGFNLKSVIREWGIKNFIEKDSQNKNTISKYIGGKQDRFIKIILNVEVPKPEDNNKIDSENDVNLLKQEFIGEISSDLSDLPWEF